MSDITKPNECAEWLAETIAATKNLPGLLVILEDAARHHGANQRAMEQAGRGPWVSYAVSVRMLENARDVVRKEFDKLNGCTAKAHARLMAKKFNARRPKKAARP